MGMLRDELYKIFTWKIIYIALGLFIFINILYFGSETGFKCYRYIYNDYRGYEGQITQQTLKHAQELETQLKQTHLDGRYTQMELSYAIDVRNVQASKKDYDKILQDMKKRLNELGYNKEAYEYRKMEKEFGAFKKAGYLDEVHYVKAWQNIIQYNLRIGFLFIGILIVIGIAPSFSEEYRQRMDAILLSSRYGRTRLITAKITACLLYCIFIVGIFAMLPIAFYSYTYGLYGFDAPLKQMYPLYSMSPLNMKIWQFYFIQRGYLLMGSFSLGILVLIISSLVKSTLAAAFTGGGIFLIPTLLNVFGVNFNNSISNKQFNYGGFMKLEHMFDSVDNISSFMGNPVQSEYILLGIMCILILISCNILYALFKRREAI